MITLVMIKIIYITVLSKLGFHLTFFIRFYIGDDVWLKFLEEIVLPLTDKHKKYIKYKILKKSHRKKNLRKK
jgi:hypothetical protein